MMVTEKIGVTYLSVLGGAAYHMALFYEDSSGQKFVIEASPQFDMGQISITDQLGEAVKEIFSENQNDGSPYGFLVGGVRPWSPDPPYLDDSRPSETLVTGDNLQGRWGALVAAAGEAFAAHYEYRPLQQNSNTFVATLLEDAGLPQPADNYLTPAYSYRLHDPLMGPIDPTALGATNFRFGEITTNKSEVKVGQADITVEWSNGAVNIAANGTSVDNLVDTPINDNVGSGTSVFGDDGHVVLVGSSSSDVFDGHGGDCLLLAGP